MIMALLGPQALPKLALREGVPSELRTVVVVPTLLTGQAQIAEQIERLEVHYLANSDGDLRFVLLSDWTDAPSETMPQDEALLAAAVEGIAQLNRRHGPVQDGSARCLFHRRRGWSEGEQNGWDGNVNVASYLNSTVCSAAPRITTFLPTNGQALIVPSWVRYVITLDADTQLPRGAACRLVGVGASSQCPGLIRKLAGSSKDMPYSSRVSRRRSRPIAKALFQQISSGPCGIDPYASAVSDVYQDLLAEGSYTGKGICDIDAFEAALRACAGECLTESRSL
jgi:cyclic beta-1,2-glucan synthetase